MALSEFDRKYLTDAQQKAIIEATTAWNIAKRNNDQAGMDAAAKRAAAVRAQAGYSGGKDGTGYTALGNGGKPKVVNDLSPLAVERADERDKSNAASATRQAAQTAPNTPVAKGSFTGNRETTYTPKFSAGKLVAGTVEKGLNEFSQGIGATGAALEKVLLSPLDLVTGEKFGTAASEIGLFSKARENDRQTGERLQQKYASNVEAGGKAAQLVDKYGTMTVAAIPDALLAVATGGGSAAPTVGKAAQSAAYKIAESYAKNPQFWASVARVFGTGYEQAKADGASEADAYAYALGNGMFNAAIEVGGGIQTLPRELQNESVWRAVGKTMLEEAGEEVTQGIAERGAQNIFYNKGNPLFSATDPNAVLNPNTAKEEAIGGAVVGGLLGGGQAGTVNLINAIVNAQNTAPQTHNTDTAQIPSQIPRSAENGGNLTGKEKMPTAAVNEAAEGIIVPPAQNAEVQATVERGRSDRPLGNNATQEGVATDGIVAQNEHMSSERRARGYENLADYLDRSGASENPTGTVGAAQAGFTTPNAQGTEQTSKLSESIPYSKAQAEATGLTSDEYARIFRYQSQTEERSMSLADDLLYVYDGETGRRTFLRDYDEASFHELVKSLDEAPAWNAPMMDAARMIQQELQGRSANMEIDSDEYIDFLRILREHETATGQGVQANAKWSRSDNEAGAGSETDAWENLQNSNLTESERAARFQRIVQWDARIEQVSEGDTASLKQIIMEVAQERGVLNTALANRRSGVISRIAGNALDSLTFPQLKQFAYASTSALSVDANEANIGQKLKTLQVLNMLSNPRTASKNILSNTAFYGLDAAAMRGGAILDMALSQITGTRSVAFEQSALSKTATGAAVKAMKMSIAEIALDVDMNAEQNRYGRSGSRTFKASGNLAERVLSSVERNEAFLLTATDEFYKGAARSTAKSTQKLVDAGKIKAGKDYATQQADALARYRTFQDDSRLSVAIQTIHDTLNLIGIGDSGKTMRGKTVHAFGVGDLVAPFTRVAGNIVTRGVEFSPIGAVNGTVEIAGVIADAARGNVDVAKQAKAVSDTARGLTGTAIAFGFMALAQAGLLRDADDEDNENVAAFNATEGVSGTQLNIDAAKRFVSGGNAAWQSGDTLLDLSSIEPLNMLVDLGAKLAKNDGSGILSVFKTTGASVAESAAELPVMSTVGNAATDIIRYHEPAGEVVARELGSTAVSSVIPNILAAAAKGMDDRPRNTYTGDTLANIIRDNAKNKVPGLRETLPASTSVTGEPKTYQGDATKRLVDAIVNPFGTSTYEQGDVSKEMERVRNATGDASFYPTKAIPSGLKANGKTVQLDYAQRQDFQRERGKTTIEAMRAMMATGAYRSASDTEKAELLNLCGDYAYYAAKAGVLGDDSVDAKWISARNAQKEAGSVRGAVDFLLERKKQSDAAAKAKEEKAAAWEKTLTSLKPYGVTQEVLDDADLNGGGVNQAEMAAYLKTRGDLDAAAKQMIWMSVGGWKTSYADYTKKHK